MSPESRARSLTKSFTWRIVVVIVLFLVTYFLTGDVPRASAITIIFNLIQIVLYYFHERVWARIEWGKRGGSMIWFWVCLGALVASFLVAFLLSSA